MVGREVVRFVHVVVHSSPRCLHVLCRYNMALCDVLRVEVLPHGTEACAVCPLPPPSVHTDSLPHPLTLCHPHTYVSCSTPQDPALHSRADLLRLR